MANYKGIKGVKVESLASDPSDTSENTGTVWYNTADSGLKYAIAGSGTWATGNNCAYERHYAATAKRATQSAGLVFSGFDGPTWPSPGTVIQTEAYDGTSWTEVADQHTTRALPGGTGTQTAAICWSGTPYVPAGSARTSNTELYDGTCWTEVNNVLTATSAPGSIGIQTAALSVGGSLPPQSDICQQWDGTCWSEVNDTLVAVSANCSTGIITAGLNAGGSPTPVNGLTSQTWDGTCWTAGNNMNNIHEHAASFGDQTATIIAGNANPSPSAKTEKYDGTSWSETTDLGNPKYGLSGLGTASLGLTIGGPPTLSKSTEEWTDPVYAIKTVTVS